MLFTQDRTRTRELFRSSWKKHIDGEALEPLEKQITSLLDISPEHLADTWINHNSLN